MAKQDHSRIASAAGGHRSRGRRICSPERAARISPALPFTPKTPSFAVHPVKQIYHCFGCSAGDVFKFIVEMDRCNLEAIRTVAEKCGIALPSPRDRSPEGARAIAAYSFGRDAQRGCRLFPAADQAQR
jgi:hypothetical protein